MTTLMAYRGKDYACEVGRVDEPIVLPGVMDGFR